MKKCPTKTITRGTIMMRWLIAVSGASVLAGCAIAPEFDECDNSATTQINITWQKQNNMVKVQAAPNKVEVDAGDTLRFKFSGNPSATVDVDGKASDPDSFWIDGDGTGTNGYFFVCVPGNVQKGRSYFYEVDV